MNYELKIWKYHFSFRFGDIFVGPLYLAADSCMSWVRYGVNTNYRTTPFPIVSYPLLGKKAQIPFSTPLSLPWVFRSFSTQKIEIQEGTLYSVGNIAAVLQCAA